MVPMTPETLDITRLIDIICDAFDSNEPEDDAVLYTPEGLIARSALILLWTLSSDTPQKSLSIVLRQVGESIEFLADRGMSTAEELAEALEIISGATPGMLPPAEEDRFQEIVGNL